MKFSVKTFREVGLEAKWSKRKNGSPIIVVRNPNGLPHQRKWWVCDRNMWENMGKLGIMDGFHSSTLMGDLFYEG